MCALPASTESLHSMVYVSRVEGGRKRTDKICDRERKKGGREKTGRETYGSCSTSQQIIKVKMPFPEEKVILYEKHGYNRR
jgi:hypothetical protein